LVVIELSGDEHHGGTEVVAVEQFRGEAVATAVALTLGCVEMDLHGTP